jgi:hypothetical protein
MQDLVFFLAAALAVIMPSSRFDRHQQITGAALMHLGRFHAMKLVTLDQATNALCPWSGNLEIIVP